MPVLNTGQFDIDYIDVGEGPVVILIHSAASNNRQWRKLVDDYQHQYRFLAINLFGYGETSEWPDDTRQTMADQVGLVLALCDIVDGPIYIVGHSFGGAIAAMVAVELEERVKGLVLLEANPFPLLHGEKTSAAYAEILELRDFIKHHGGSGDWTTVAERFVDYWIGDGAWASLADDRKQAFIAALPNNYHEWDAIMDLDSREETWRGIRAETLLLRAGETVNSIRGIYEVLQEMCPHWEYREISEGGHMAPVVRPELVNPVIMEFFQKID